MSDAPKKVVTYEEFKQNGRRDSLYVLLHNKVYNVTKFLDEHPGGDEVILAEAGKDATEAFEDVGHSDEARALLEDLYIGDFEENSVLKSKDVPEKVSHSNLGEDKDSSSIMAYLLPLAFLGAYFAWRFYSS